MWELISFKVHLHNVPTLFSNFRIFLFQTRIIQLFFYSTYRLEIVPPITLDVCNLVWLSGIGAVNNFPFTSKSQTYDGRNNRGTYSTYFSAFFPFSFFFILFYQTQIFVTPSLLVHITRISASLRLRILFFFIFVLNFSSSLTSATLYSK